LKLAYCGGFDISLKKRTCFKLQQHVYNKHMLEKIT